MATYYVAPWGDSGNPGTLVSPWADITDANGVVSPGDTVYLRGGVYNDHARPALSVGTAGGAEVLFSSYPGETAILQARELDTGLTEIGSTNEWEVTVSAFGGGAYEEVGVWLSGKLMRDLGEAVGSLSKGAINWDAATDTLTVQSDYDLSNGCVWTSQTAALRLSGCGNIRFVGIGFQYAYKAVGRMSLYGDSAHVGNTTFYQCFFTDIFRDMAQPLERGWRFEQCYVARIGPYDGREGPTNYSYAFYSGSDTRQCVFKDNIIEDVLSYVFHLYPASANASRHVIDHNLWYGYSNSGIVVVDGGSNVADVTDNIFYGRLDYTDRGPLYTSGLVLRTGSNYVANNTFINLANWQLEDGSTNVENTFVNNTVYNCGYYSDDNHRASRHSGTTWHYTPGMVTRLRFAHNGTSLGSAGTDFSTAREQWSAYAPWVQFTPGEERPPTVDEYREEFLADFPDHGYARYMDQRTCDIGVSYVAPLYTITGATSYRLTDAVATMKTGLGVKTVKLFLSNEYATQFTDDTIAGPPTTLTALAQAEPISTVLADASIQTVFLNCFTFSNDGDEDLWKFGFDTQTSFLSNEYTEIYNLCVHLLSTYAGSGKTFVISTWEGDWAYIGAFDPTQVVPRERARLMQCYLRVRQRAVKAAIAATPSDVKLLNAIEVNRVYDALGIPTKQRLVNDVLPFVYCDMVSYSAYDVLTQMQGSQSAHTAFVESYLPLCLEAIQEAAPQSQLAIGEFGWPENEYDFTSTYDMAECFDTVINIGNSYDLKYLLYWQMWDNEAGAGPPTYRGFWCQDDAGDITEAGTVIRDLCSGSGF